MRHHVRNDLPAAGGQEGSVIGHVTPGTNDLQRAAEFYDRLAQEMGVVRMMESERFVA